MDNYRRIFADICRGYSISSWKGRQIFIKHLSQLDQVEIDDFYDLALKNAIKRGIPTQKNRLQWLNKKKWWTDKEEIELMQQRDYVSGLMKGRDKLLFEAQKKQQDQIIDVERKKLDKLIEKKSSLIELTAELVAHERCQYQYILSSFYKDKNLEIPLFNQQDIDDLSHEDSAELMQIYVDMISKFTDNVFKKIAVSNFFISYFYLCEDDVSKFFDRPIIKLSFHQMNLISYGTYFKKIMSQNEIPNSISEDPEKIEEYVKTRKNWKEVMDKTGDTGGRTGLVGASQADFDNLNIRNSAADMNNIIQKGYTNAMDAAKDLGYTIKDS